MWGVERPETTPLSTAQPLQTGGPGKPGDTAESAVMEMGHLGEPGKDLAELQPGLS